MTVWHFISTGFYSGGYGGDWGFNNEIGEGYNGGLVANDPIPPPECWTMISNHQAHEGQMFSDITEVEKCKQKCLELGADTFDFE